MKKILVLLLATIAFFNGRIAKADEKNNEQLVKTLSSIYGAPVEVDISEKTCEIRYPTA